MFNVGSSIVGFQPASYAPDSTWKVKLLRDVNLGSYGWFEFGVRELAPDRSGRGKPLARKAAASRRTPKPLRGKKRND